VIITQLQVAPVELVVSSQVEFGLYTLWVRTTRTKKALHAMLFCM